MIAKYLFYQRVLLPGAGSAKVNYMPFLCCVLHRLCVRMGQTASCSTRESGVRLSLLSFNRAGGWMASADLTVQSPQENTALLCCCPLSFCY